MNRAERKSIFGYELAGIIFIVIIGSMLHFTFELSGHQPVVGVFSAVNESVWEHMKLGFWPALVWALFEYRSIRESTSNFFFAKTVGIYLIPVVIPILFYSYTAVIGESVLVIDILTFVVAVVIGQIVSYKLLTYEELPDVLNKISLVALVLLGVAFVVFTFYPPHLPLFRDPVTGEYGITNHVHACTQYPNTKRFKSHRKCNKIQLVQRIKGFSDEDACEKSRMKENRIILLVAFFEPYISALASYAVGNVFPMKNTPLPSAIAKGLSGL